VGVEALQELRFAAKASGVEQHKRPHWGRPGGQLRPVSSCDHGDVRHLPSGGAGTATPWPSGCSSDQDVQRARSPAVAPPTAVGRGSVRGLVCATATFWFSDELEAGARALADIGRGGGSFQESYDRHVIRKDLGAFREANQGTALAAEGAGGVLFSGLGTAGLVSRGATAKGGVARGVAAGAGSGALVGAGTAEGGLSERGQGAIPGALVGGPIGAAVPAVANRVSALWNKWRGPKAPTVEQLEAEASARCRVTRPDPAAPAAGRGFMSGNPITIADDRREPRAILSRNLRDLLSDEHFSVDGTTPPGAAHGRRGIPVTRSAKGFVSGSR
jgi:hypothetical protein